MLNFCGNEGNFYSDIFFYSAWMYASTRDWYKKSMLSTHH